MSENTTEQKAEQGKQPAADEKPATFTQEEVDRMIRDRLKRERERFADYDDLKVKAEGAKSVEQQLADLKTQNAKILRDNLAARIAARHGIAPEDVDLFLTGSDEDTLTAQAKRLAERDLAVKKSGPVVPNEGTASRNNNSADSAQRDFARRLFGTT